jgi:Ca2+-binding EF-hand superfamily protein
MDAYQMLDLQGKGWVTGPEIVEALSDYGVHAHKEDVYLFVRHYDRDSDGRLLFSDFCDAFCPKDKQSANVLNNR